MSKHIDFRETFGRLHDDVLINLGEFAVVAGSTRAGMYKALERHPKALPEPVRLNSGKRAPIRFRVGDVRQWIRRKGDVSTGADAALGLGAEVKSHPVETHGGRPRMSVDVPGFSSRTRT